MELFLKRSKGMADLSSVGPAKDDGSPPQANDTPDEATVLSNVVQGSAPVGAEMSGEPHTPSKKNNAESTLTPEKTIGLDGRPSAPALRNAFAGKRWCLADVVVPLVDSKMNVIDLSLIHI